MKLNELAINGYGVCRDLRLGPFNNGLNIVFGETGTGKTTLRNFVRGVIFGFDRPINYAASSGTNVANGQVDVRFGNCDYRLTRDVQLSGNINIEPLSNVSNVGNVAASVVHGVAEMSGNLNLSLYDSVFNVGFHDTRTNVTTLAGVLHSHLGVPVGSTTGRDEAAYARWQSESESISREISALQQRIDSLTIEKRGYENQIDNSRSLRDQQLSGVENEINEVNLRIAAIDPRAFDNRIANLTAEITRLRELIANSEAQYAVKTQVVAPVTNYDSDTSLYQRLDEIDNQIRRWRNVQTDIQSQRVRLRDEMLEWSELTLESAQHPYHNARGILVALETRLDQVEKHNRSATVTTVADQQAATQQMDELCQNMRSDIYNLCQELGRQYKHIRQKSAAAELKQLRRCYDEMGENTGRLVGRRKVLIQELRKVDPAGADAIERADTQFCQCAQHEGHLAARRKFVGNLPTVSTVAPIQPTYQVANPDLSNLRAQLQQVENHRAQEQANRDRLDGDHRNLGNRHTELVAQRERLLAQLNQNDLIAKINNVDVELRRLTEQYNVLNRRLQDLEYVESTHPVIELASNYLSRMTMNELNVVWLADQSGSVVAKDRVGNAIPFVNLSRGQQDQVYLSLALAARDTLASQGVVCPMLLDDVFANLDSQRVVETFNVVSEHCRQDNQTIVLAKSNEIVRPSTSANVAIFELPPRIAPSSPYVAPLRQPETPSRPLEWESSSLNENRFYQSYRTPTVESDASRQYPLSKYPGNGVRTPVSPSTFEHHEPVRAATYDVVESVQPVIYPRPVVQEYPAQPEIAVHVDALEPVTEDSRVTENAILDASNMSMLSRVGVRKVKDLLVVDPTTLNNVFTDVGITREMLESWQTSYWMMLCVPSMDFEDLRILAACGVTNPEQLDTTNSQHLLEQINTYLSSTGNGRYPSKNYSPELVNRWYRSLDSTRSKWNRGRSRRTGSQDNPVLRTYDSNDRQRSDRETESRRQSRLPRASRIRSSRRSSQPVTTTPMVQNFTQRQRTENPSTARSTSKTNKSVTKSTAKSKSTRKLKFYLELDDHIEAAPSIGNRMADRFEQIGVSTIRSFLAQTAESMAAKMNYKRADADTIRDWQKQSRLVLRIPNLRGHDAQLLVACDITEPEDISVMPPQKLLDIIGPFSDTKEGLKIIRSGKKPDLDEIKDWIEWAGHTRSVQAA